MDTIQLAHAEVAELADALGSGLSSCKGVRVQVPPSALKKLAFSGFFVLLALSHYDLLSAPTITHAIKATWTEASGKI